MISNSKISPTLPVVDLERAKKFYRDNLGLKIVFEDPSGIMFESSDHSQLYLYQRGPTKADHTVLSFEVEHIESEVNELRRKGIKFEDYDMPEMHLKTVNGIATFPVMPGGKYETKSAWFKDTEGNILALTQMVKVGSKERGEPVGSRR